MRKRWISLALLVCILPVLSGCMRGKEEDKAPAPTYAPAESRYNAPDGDATIAEEQEYMIYLPGRNGLHLIPRPVYLEAANLNERVETLVNTLIRADSDEQSLRLGGSRTLSLYGQHPVELSSGICTVNLASAALNLSHSEFYKTCLALSTTLCALDEIHSVNVLVADQSIGLDISGNLPMGSLTAHAGENLPVLWEQMEAKRTPLGEDLSRTPLSSLATIYYPLAEGRGIGCISRMVSFEGQTPQQLAAGLIDEIGQTAVNPAGSADIPRLREFLVHDPVTSELEDGGRLITLSFREDRTEELLALWKTDMACLAAAVTYTMTTFIPGVAAVCIRIGEKPMTELGNSRFEPVAALGGLVARNTLETFLMSSVTVYFDRNGILCECERPINRKAVDSPRAQLCVLLEGPDETETEQGIAATLPSMIREDDILGVSREGDTLLLNLSEGFRSEIQSQGREKESMICYSMVNTLCLNTGLKRVRFYFEGEQIESIAGEIYWAGEFLYNTGLAEKGLG